MIRINVQNTLKKAAEERLKPKPLPKIIIKGSRVTVAKPVHSTVSVNIEADIKKPVKALDDVIDASLVMKLEVEYSNLKKRAF